MSIYITGDIHGDPRRLSAKHFPPQSYMTKDDYVIILGDFGLVWSEEESDSEKYWLQWLENKPFTTLFVDGNHDNFDRLNHDYLVKDWMGGKVHEIRPSVLHLVRGEIFELKGKKFFAFGGASSHDIQDGILEPDDKRIYEWNKLGKMFRVNHLSWWKEELPSDEEMNNALNNLDKHDWKVDFVLTHSPAASTLALMGNGWYKQDILTKFFEELRMKLDYDKWLFGHMHEDRFINDKEICFYEKIVRMV